MKKATENERIVTINPVEKAYIKLTIVGDTPLIVHNWSEKAKREMRDAQTGASKGTKKKEFKNIYGDFAGTLYWMDGAPDVEYKDWTPELCEELMAGARFGFPAGAIKAAANTGASRAKYIKNTKEMVGEFHIMGEGDSQLIEIHHEGIPKMREDNVRLSGIGRVADLRYRASFFPWSMDLTVMYDPNGNITPEGIVNIINIGGMKCGIGEWRVEKNGQFGMFHVGV